jgi:hypothetical protein
MHTVVAVEDLVGVGVELDRDQDARLGDIGIEPLLPDFPRHGVWLFRQAIRKWR